MSGTATIVVILLIMMLGVALVLLHREGRALKISRQRLSSAEDDLKMRRLEVAEALARVRSLQGMLAICSCCKSIRDPEGRWKQMEEYLEFHFQTHFSHGVCPECMRVEYPGLFENA